MKENRKQLIGRVVSDKMAQTVVVRVDSQHSHPLYHRIVRTSKKFKAHDEQSDSHLGDLVRIEESRPISKEKHWKVVEVIQRREVAAIQPREIGAAEEGAQE